MKQKLYVIIALLCAVVQGAWGQKTVDLSTITGDYTIPDGATVTGTSKDKKYMISIAAGATITFSGLTIEQDGSETGYNQPVSPAKATQPSSWPRARQTRSNHLTWSVLASMFPNIIHLASKAEAHS